MELKEIEENLFKRLYKGAYLERQLMSFFFIYQDYKFKLIEFHELRLENNNPDIQRLLEKSALQSLSMTLLNLNSLLMNCQNFIMKKSLEALGNCKIKNFSKETAFIGLLSDNIKKEEQDLESLENDKNDLETLRKENRMLKEEIKRLSE